MLPFRAASGGSDDLDPVRKDDVPLRSELCRFEGEASKNLLIVNAIAPKMLEIGGFKRSAIKKFNIS